MIARGAMLGPDQPVILHLLDIPPAAQALEGVRMELIDAAYPLVKGRPVYNHLKCEKHLHFPTIHLLPKAPNVRLIPTMHSLHGVAV